MSRRWIKKYLNEKEIAEISTAVQKAEENTLGDIVPMVVRRSAAIRHVPVILALSFALIFMGIEMAGLNGWYLGDVIPFLYKHWTVQFVFILILMMIAWWLSHYHPVQRFLTSDVDEQDQVEKRAQLEFFLHRLNRTHKKTAVLIFVSIMERRAVILADEGIAKKLPPNTWDEVMKSLSHNLKKGAWSEGLQDAIRRSGELLKSHFPAEKGQSPNEIGNHLIVKE
jgi:putative membrane protein